MFASEKGCTKIAKILLEQKGIDTNAKNVYLFLSKFISVIWYFKTIFRNSSNYTEHRLCLHLKKFIMKLLK